MWNYHPDVIVETFVRFHPGRSFTLPGAASTTTRSCSPPTTRSSRPRCRREACPIPSVYDKSKLLQIACVSPGTFDAAVIYAAGAYVRALNLGWCDRLTDNRKCSGRIVSDAGECWRTS